MVEDFKPQLLRCLILQRLDCRIIELDRTSTLHAHHMVVVFVIVKVLVTRDPVGKINFAREAEIHQNFHRAIYSRVSDPWIMFTDDAIDVFHASMSFVIKKYIEDQLTVRRQLESPALQVFHEYLQLRRKDFHISMEWAVLEAAA